MRILMMIPSLGPGGAEKVMSMLSRAFVERGHGVEVVTVIGSATDDFYSLEGVERTSIDLGKPSSGRVDALFNGLARVRALRRAVRRSRPDVVVSFLTETNVLAYLACFKLGVPVVVSEHTDPDRCPLRPEWRLLRKAIYPRCARLVAPNRHIASRFSTRIRRRMDILPNPVRPPAGPRADSVGARSTILTVGRMSREKNHRMLIDAFAVFARDFPDWDLVIVGDGPLKEETVRYANDKGLGESVVFAGLVTDPWSTLASRAAMFVLSSDYEGFPMALCEAMSAGLPVICTRYHDGVEELVEEGRNGLVVPVGDSGALADAMRQLALHPSLRVAMGREGPLISRRYDLTRVAESWLTLLGSAAGISMSEPAADRDAPHGV